MLRLMPCLFPDATGCFGLHNLLKETTLPVAWMVAKALMRFMPEALDFPQVLRA